MNVSEFEYGMGLLPSMGRLSKTRETRAISFPRLMRSLSFLDLSV